MSASKQNDRCGMTLIEMLIATAVSLILMAAVAQVFAAFSGAMSNGRSILETDSRLRNVARRLRDDLNGATTQMLPPRTPDQGEGYFEIIEGPLNDYQDASNSGIALVSGTTEVCPTDIDDVLLFTTRDTESPFVGRLLSNTIESSTAEVAWFARPTPGTSNPVTYTLYRKQLLVMGYVGTTPFNNNNQMAFPGTWSGYFVQPCDISARRERRTTAVPFDRLVPNTLSDLTRRENRFLHNPMGGTTGNTFPYVFASDFDFNGNNVLDPGTPGDGDDINNNAVLDFDHLSPSPPEGLIFDGTTRAGEDIILTNVLSFDVRVFDPAAPVELNPAPTVPPAPPVVSTAIIPGDPGFSGGGSGHGAYVDLGHSATTNALPSTNPLFSSSRSVDVTNGTPLPRTYCTWSTHYEANGIDEDGIDGTDQGTDGLDNDLNSLVDESAEQETSPPYPYPLRGIEVRIRVYEPKSRQARQVTVRHTFVPH